MMTVTIQINNKYFKSLKAVRIEPETEIPEKGTLCKYRVEYKNIAVGVTFAPYGDIYFLSEQLIKFMKYNKKEIEDVDQKLSYDKIAITRRKTRIKPTKNKSTYA